jgi:hypothetical protein
MAGFLIFSMVDGGQQGIGVWDGVCSVHVGKEVGRYLGNWKGYGVWVA